MKQTVDVKAHRAKDFTEAIGIYISTSVCQHALPLDANFILSYILKCFYLQQDGKQYCKFL